MLLRPTDPSGDILPVLSSSALLSGPEAVAQLVKYRLSLLRGEWWENLETGFQILEALSSSRLTEADAQTLSSMISEYIRETPGVREVEDVQCAFSGRQLQYACSVRTEDGTAEVIYKTEA